MDNLSLTSTARRPHRIQLRHQVAERIRTAILEGELRPGQWLRQERLAQEYGVSQMPVREALKELATEGLVEHVPFHGVRVIEFSPDDVEDLYAHRAFLEGQAAGFAAQNITSTELAELRDLESRMRQRVELEHLLEYRQLNRRFHQMMIAASRRPYLIRTLAQLWTAFPSMLWGNFENIASYSLPERSANDLEEHSAILTAMESRDAGQARACVRYHIETAGRHLVAALRQQAEHGGQPPSG